MSGQEQLNNYHIRVLFYAVLLQAKKNKKQVIIHQETLKEAQRICSPKRNEDLWEWICNPLAKTFEFLAVKPKIQGATSIEAAFSELWSELEENQNAIRAISGE